MKSQPVLPLRDMSGSIAVEQQGSLSMSMVYVTPKDHSDIPGLVCHLRLH